MKLQHLTVIFIIIILPISLILDAYIKSRIETTELQISYDTKLTGATRDAIEAFQQNTVNSSTSDLANSKIRDVLASVNTFFNAIATNFNMVGYNSDILQNYVPALVFTLYDGYYIYTPFNNILNDTTVTEDSTYQNNEKLYGLKPYIYYSCRYKTASLDVVINYSLDNYISIQGTRNGVSINNAGYLIDNVEVSNGGNTVKYRGIEIQEEAMLEEYVGQTKYPYIKINGVKYYQDTDGSWFALLNGEKSKQETLKVGPNDSAKRYYKEAAEFRQWLVDNGILDLKETDAVDENGNKLNDLRDENGESVYHFKNQNIFTYQQADGTSIEEPSSVFNEHRLAIIRRSIERNLSLAIANYNKYTTVTTDFQMPCLKEEEWDQVLNHVCMISFLQGLSIGGKIYNGYSIVSNNTNEEVVTEESIYIAEKNDTLGNPGYYYRVEDTTLNTQNLSQNNYIGVFNMDFERKSMPITDDQTDVTQWIYYYPKPQLGSYTSIVSATSMDERLGDNIYQYLEQPGLEQLAKLYYTALGRERYGMYKLERNADELKQTYM